MLFINTFSIKVVLLAFAEGRNGVPNATTCERDESCPDKSLLVRTSKDLGNTWSSIKLIDIVECAPSTSLLSFVVVL